MENLTRWAIFVDVLILAVLSVDTYISYQNMLTLRASNAGRN